MTRGKHNAVNGRFEHAVTPTLKEVTNVDNCNEAQCSSVQTTGVGLLTDRLWNGCSWNEVALLILHLKTADHVLKEQSDGTIAE